MIVNSIPIGVTSRSFSQHPVLRAELLAQYSNVRFNDEGVALHKESLIEVACGRHKLITALEQIDDSDAELSPELQKEIEAMVAWADASTPDPYERQAVINAAFNVLFRAGMADDFRCR